MFQTCKSLRLSHLGLNCGQDLYVVGFLSGWKVEITAKQSSVLADLTSLFLCFQANIDSSSNITLVSHC